MRYLHHHDLFELAESEAPAVLASLRQLGYCWLQESAGKNHNLYDRSGQLCVGEMFQKKLYLDGCVKEDLTLILSGQQEPTWTSSN